MTSPALTKQSSGPTPTNVLFDEAVTDELHRDQIVDLAAGTLGAIKVRNFFSHRECEEMMENLEHVEMGSYDEQLVIPRIPKLGPAAFDYYDDKGLDERYWEHSKQSAASRRRLLNGRDPLDVAMERVRLAWEGPMSFATSGDNPLFAGMIREMTNGAGIHFDELVREFPGSIDQKPIAQLAFNCHLSMPESGGELNVFRRRWDPADEPTRGDSYWYPEPLVSAVPSVSVRADVGDAVFFDPRNYHRILPRTSEGRRVTLSFFLGILSEGTMIVWS